MAKEEPIFTASKHFPRWRGFLSTACDWFIHFAHICCLHYVFHAQDRGACFLLLFTFLGRVGRILICTQLRFTPFLQDSTWAKKHPSQQQYGDLSQCDAIITVRSRSKYSKCIQWWVIDIGAKVRCTFIVVSCSDNRRTLLKLKRYTVYMFAQEIRIFIYHAGVEFQNSMGAYSHSTTT